VGDADTRLQHQAGNATNWNVHTYTCNVYGNKGSVEYVELTFFDVQYR
jgi:hypothetical protein